MASDESESRTFRRAGISYRKSVFGWTVDTARADPSFEDGTGHVIGQFIAEAPVAGEAGVPDTPMWRAWSTRSSKSLAAVARR